MGHVVLLGDSIFDNAGYVPGGPSVIDHLRARLPDGWRATLLAVDGDVAEGVASQARGLPADATHLVVSAGGNNALRHSSLVLYEPAGSFAEVLDRLGAIREEFQLAYRRMLDVIRAPAKPVAVCTIYDAIPGLERAQRAGLCLFNEVILREAARAGVPVIDLRLVCDATGDYSGVSPIEPSAAGGAKIADAVARLVAPPDAFAHGCRIVT